MGICKRRKRKWKWKLEMVVKMLSATVAIRVHIGRVATAVVIASLCALILGSVPRGGLAY